jgi:hypothetical protein
VGGVVQVWGGCAVVWVEQRIIKDNLPLFLKIEQLKQTMTRNNKFMEVY